MDTREINEAVLENLDYVTRVVANIVPSHLVEETAADAILHLMEYSLPRYDGTRASVRTFIARAVANFARNVRSAHRNSREHEAINATGHKPAESDAPSTGRELASQIPTPQAALLRKEQMMLTRRAMGELNAAEREFMALLLDGQKVKDAGAAIGLTPVQASRAHKAIKARLADRCEDFHAAGKATERARAIGRR